MALEEGILDKIVLYVDNIYVPGRNTQEHLQILDEILERLEEAGATVSLKKCCFLTSTLKF